ncbi:Uncharacterised protein [Yersinia mollaretii]|nr:Uncharacterised protein [Yersinia mollaretii]CQQ51282.1 Uncharacterised protein [Yersinia mollaretii]
MGKVNEFGSIANNLKKYSYYVLKLSPLCVVFSVLVVWGYLGHFSRLDLLMGSVGNNTILLSIFFRLSLCRCLFQL